MRLIIGNAALRQELKLKEMTIELLEAKLKGMEEVNSLYRQAVEAELWRQGARAEEGTLFAKVLRSLTADAVVTAMRQGVKNA